MTTTAAAPITAWKVRPGPLRRRLRRPPHGRLDLPRRLLRGPRGELDLTGETLRISGTSLPRPASRSRTRTSTATSRAPEFFDSERHPEIRFDSATR